MLLVTVLTLATATTKAQPNPTPRELLSLRTQRRLPGSKGGGGASSSTKTKTSTSNRNCVGSFSAWSSCANDQELRTYTVTRTKMGSGSSCPTASGTRETRACNDCVGAWSCWSTCDASTLKKSHTYTVAKPSTGSGSACPATDGQTVLSDCTVADHTVDWAYYSAKDSWSASSLNDITPFPVAVEHPVVHCNKGETVEIGWSAPSGGSTMQHDLWSLPNEEEYVKCDFDTTGGARELVPKAASCGHVVQCDTPGTKYFACNVDGACENGLQRIRLITTDSDKTAALKNQAGMSTFQTLAEVMEKELVPVAYSQDQGTALTDAKADGEWGVSVLVVLVVLGLLGLLGLLVLLVLLVLLPVLHFVDRHSSHPLSLPSPHCLPFNSHSSPAGSHHRPVPDIVRGLDRSLQFKRRHVQSFCLHGHWLPAKNSTHPQLHVRTHLNVHTTCVGHYPATPTQPTGWRWALY